MEKQERKLTPQEQKRHEAFEKIAEQMVEEGYRRHELTIGVTFANIVGPLIILPVCLIVAMVYFYSKESEDFLYLQLGWSFFVLLGILFVVHELIHGVVWTIFAKEHMRSVSFGVIPKFLTPYCVCEEPLKKWQYILGALMPTLILGFGLAGAAIAMRSDLIFLLSECMILGGCGDVLIVGNLLRYKPEGKDVMVYDHPDKIGAVLFER